MTSFINQYFVLTIFYKETISLPVFLLGPKCANMWASELLSTMLVTLCAAGLGWNTRPHWPVSPLGSAAHLLAVSPCLLLINNIRRHNKAQLTYSTNFVIHEYTQNKIPIPEAVQCMSYARVNDLIMNLNAHNLAMYTQISKISSS